MGKQYATKPYALETKVPHFGRIKVIKSGEMEWEYLLVKAGTVTWLSHADIKAILEQVDPMKRKAEDVLNKYIATYNLGVLGFRESGQASAQKALCEDLLAALPNPAKLSIPNDDMFYGFEMAIREAEQAIRSYFGE